MRERDMVFITSFIIIMQVQLDIEGHIDDLHFDIASFAENNKLNLIKSNVGSYIAFCCH